MSEEGRYSKPIDVNLEDIQVVEKKNADYSAYQGKKVKIDKVEVKEEINFYADGKTYDANSKEKCFKIYLISEPLKTLDDKGNFTDQLIEIPQEDGSTKHITVHARFNLGTSDDGKPEIRKGPKAKLWPAMKKLGCTKLNEIKGKLVMLDLEPSKVEGDDRKYLRMAL